MGDLPVSQNAALAYIAPIITAFGGVLYGIFKAKSLTRRESLDAQQRKLQYDDELRKLMFENLHKEIARKDAELDACYLEQEKERNDRRRERDGWDVERDRLIRRVDAAIAKRDAWYDCCHELRHLMLNRMSWASLKIESKGGVVPIEFYTVKQIPDRNEEPPKYDRNEPWMRMSPSPALPQSIETISLPPYEKPGGS